MMFGHVQPLSLGLGTRAQVPGWGRKCRAAQTSVSLSSVPVQAERRSQQHPRAPSTTLSRPPSTGFYDAQPQHTHAQEAAVALLVVEGLKLLLNGQAKLPQGQPRCRELADVLHLLRKWHPAIAAARGEHIAQLAGVLHLLREWHPRADFASPHTPGTLPAVHAATLAAAAAHWAQPGMEEHGDCAVMRRLLLNGRLDMPPSFAQVFPYLVGHEYRTPTGMGDLLFTNGWGIYAAVEAKSVPAWRLACALAQFDSRNEAQRSAESRALRRASSKRWTARAQARRYADDIRHTLRNAVVVLPFTAFLHPLALPGQLDEARQAGVPTVNGQRQEWEGMLGAPEAEVVLQCVPYVPCVGEAQARGILGLQPQDIYAALELLG